MAAALEVLRKEFAIWNDVKMSQTASITFSQEHSAEEKVIGALEAALCLFSKAVCAARDGMQLDIKV